MDQYQYFLGRHIFLTRPTNNPKDLSPQDIMKLVLTSTSLSATLTGFADSFSV